MPASWRTKASPRPSVATSRPTPAVALDARRVLVAGVGYRNLRDLSVGPLAIERFGPSTETVDVEDLSYGPIDVLFMLQRREPYAAAVFIAAVHRGRAPGTVTRSRWSPPPTVPDLLQERVAEAVTGVISIDNLLEICAHFGALPADVTLIEVEPRDDAWGEELSPDGRRALDAAVAMARLEIDRVRAR